MKIVIDAMGGDNAPREIIKGAIGALQQRGGFSIVFTGNEEVITKELSLYSYDKSRVEVKHACEVITNNEAPATAVRSKRDSSLVVGLKTLKEDEEAGAFISAGSTGAVLAGGIMYLGRIPGVKRPALCPAIPNVRGGMTLLCDAGANADCKPEYLAQFAVMATAYGKAAYGMDNPKVGLLNNGTEDHKGDIMHQEAFALLKETKGINFVGNVEGRDIMFGDSDIVVADGFSGNVALKSAEGCGKTVGAILKQEFSKAKMRYLIARKQIEKVKTILDYNRSGGAIFLGLKKTVVKAHGSSKAETITVTVLQAVDAVEGGTAERIAQMLPDPVEE
jgi:glycerol-3-phosphate acyltransferase PlsX